MMISLLVSAAILLLAYKLLIGWLPAVRTFTNTLSKILGFCWKKRETTHATQVEPRIFYRNHRD